MKLLKKRGIIYGAIVMLLGVGLYLNWNYIQPPEDLLTAKTETPEENAADEEAAAPPEDDYFTTSRLSREQARDEALSILRETAAGSGVEESTAASADAKIAVLAENTVKEASAENLIRAKGYADAVVMIGDGSVNVVVAPLEQGFTATDANIIKDIVVQETGVTADEIKIVEAG